MQVTLTPEEFSQIMTLHIRSHPGTFQTQLNGGTAFIFTNLGAGPTRVSGGVYWVDLSEFTQVRFKALVDVAGTTGTIGLYYSLNGTDLVALTTNTVSLASTGVVETAWENIPAAALTVCGLEAQGLGGNGTEDPAGQLVLLFR